MSGQTVAASNVIRSPQLPGFTTPAGSSGGHVQVTGFDLCFFDVLAFSCMVWHLLGAGKKKGLKLEHFSRLFFRELLLTQKLLAPEWHMHSQQGGQSCNQ